MTLSMMNYDVVGKVADVFTGSRSH